MSTQLRYYQIEAKEAVLKSLKEGVKDVMVVMATGTGKTFTACNIVKDFNRTLWLTHSEELIDQSAVALLLSQYTGDCVALKKCMRSFPGIIAFLEAIHQQVNSMFSIPSLSDIDVEQVYSMMGVIKREAMHLHAKIVVASIQTIHRRLDKIDPSTFDVIVVDECFPGETLVDGKRIDSLNIGDSVRSFNHKTGKVEIKQITNIYKKKAKSDFIRIKIEGITDIICTDNHPIYTIEYGYIPAKVLAIVKDECFTLLNIQDEHNLCNLSETVSKKSSQYKNYELLLQGMCSTRDYLKAQEIRYRMRRMWIESNCTGEDWNGITRELQQRESILLREVQERIRIESISKSNKNGTIQERLLATNEAKKSYVDSWYKRENDRILKRKDIPKQGRKWSTNKATTIASLSNKASNGVSYYIKRSKRFLSKCSELLQGGLSLCRSKISNRDRWNVSQTKEMEVSGQKKNRNSKLLRMDSAEILESGSRSGSGEVYRESYVYNIEVEGNHNYFVEDILVHNCHMAMAATWEKTINHFKYKLNLGLTATPHRADGLSLGNIYDEIVYEYSILKGIEDKFLCELDAMQIKTKINLDSVKTTGGELNLGDLAIVNNPIRNKLIVEKYKEIASGRQFIAFCVDVKHAIALCEEFNSEGIQTTFVVGDSTLCPDRKDRISGFKNSTIQGLTNCMVLTTGFDHPDTACIIMACPTKSLTKFLQCIGRGTRLKTSYKDCKIIDVVDVTSKHRLVNTWSLDADIPIEEKIFKTRAQKRQLLLDEEMRKRKTKINKEDLHDNDIKIDLYKIPKVKVIRSERMKEEATEKQLNWIAKFGYDIVNVKFTKAMCTEIISQQPATPAQIYALKMKNYDVPGSLTLGEAQAAFNEIDEREGRVPKWKQERANKYDNFVK